MAACMAGAAALQREQARFRPSGIARPIARGRIAVRVNAMNFQSTQETTLTLSLTGLFSTVDASDFYDAPQQLDIPHPSIDILATDTSHLNGYAMPAASHRPHRLQRRRILAQLAAVSGLAWAATAQACWQEAAERYNINPYVLQAIAKCESSLNPNAMNRSHTERTGTYDIGLMQINSSNLRELQALGIGERELLDACTSINVGAWILAQKIQKYGNSWEAVGAYNAACSQLKGEACTAARNRYARCVYRNLPAELKDTQASQNEAAAPAKAAPKKTKPARTAGAVVPQLVAVKVMP